MLAYNVRSSGLGIIITQLSFLLAMGRPVTAAVPNHNNIVFDLKRIFQIHNDRLQIVVGTQGFPDLETDELCTYAPYFHADHVTLFDKQFATARKRKPCVALAMHHGIGLGNDLDPKGMPYNKFATAQEYQQVFTHLTDCGYDVVTVNQPGMSLEQKVYVLNELCDFVLGYEGGIGHLTHVLGIPYFCLPWRLNDMGHPGIQPGLWLEAHRFHPDRRTWFLKDTAEFLSWDKNQLSRMVDGLHEQLGNNILFEPGTTIEPDTLKISTKNGHDLTPRIMWCETRGAYTTAFVKEHLPLENMVKYPVKSMTYNT
jgi:hypothetical protein